MLMQNSYNESANMKCLNTMTTLRKISEVCSYQVVDNSSKESRKFVQSSALLVMPLYERKQLRSYVAM